MVLCFRFEEYFFSPKRVFQKSTLVKTLLVKICKIVFEVKKKNSNLCRAFARELITVALPIINLIFITLKVGLYVPQRYGDSVAV